MDESVYKEIINSLHDGFYLVDLKRRITFWNRAAERITGFSGNEIVGKGCADGILTHVDDAGKTLCHADCPLARTLKDGKPREVEVYLHHKTGHRVPVSVRVSALRDSEGKITGATELFSDISNKSAIELRIKELEKIALLDHLTQLANRVYTEKSIESRFHERDRFGLPFGILLMDIDHFKRINDTYGHDVGDEVLKMVANTFTANSRPFDLFGRWGGDEFIGVIRNVGGSGLARIGNRTRALVENSYLQHGKAVLRVTISMGVATVRAEDTLKTLLKRADERLYQSKAARAGIDWQPG